MNNNLEQNWHSISAEKTVEVLKSNFKLGLNEKEVKARLEKFGHNKLPEEKPLSQLSMFFAQFKSPLIYILVIAGIITLIMKVYTDSLVIFMAVILNSFVGFFQEYKASKTLSELKKIVKYRALVIRNGNQKLISSEGLIPGDIFLLSAGDKVPVDGRIIEANNLKTNEMALTGEWLPAEKHSEILPKETPVPDRDNTVYMGTIVEDGKGKIICTAIGLKTEIGKVAKMIKDTKEENTPLQKKIARFAKIVGIVITIFCIAIFIEGMLTGNTFLEMFEVSIAVAVAAIPEGLPISLTVILALGMRRILQKKGLVRKLLAAETLGSTSVICTDKTATLTEGKMIVSQVLTGKKLLSPFRIQRFPAKANNKTGDHLLALKIATLANEAFIENSEEIMTKWIIRGRPTDRALLLAGIKDGINKRDLEEKMPKIDEIGFNPNNKYIAALRQSGKQELMLCLSGAPEKILELSGKLEVNGKQEKLTSDSDKKIKAKLKGLTEKGMRVIAVAYRRVPNPKSEIPKLKTYDLKELCNDLIFVGLIAIEDPLRKGVKQAIEVCKKAGIRMILVTGDHKLTAKAIAQEIGLKTQKGNIIEGKDLDKMSDEEFRKRVKNVEVYARVEPRHKLRIIEAWQDNGEIVAMTGDGINDAPALKKADIGVAVGSGTDVAKETADLILLTDAFDIIVKAIEQGRAILDNMRKVITYLLSDSFSEIILIGASLMLGFPLPILPVQILWINLVEDGLPDIALAFEPKEKDLMKRKPESPNVPLLTQEMKTIIFIIGLVTDILLLGLFIFLWQKTKDIQYTRTMIFTALGVDSLLFVFSCKSLKRNIWHINLFSNKFLALAVLFGFLTLIVSLYLPPLQNLLKTTPLALNDWLIIIGLGIIEIILIETAKYYFISRHQC